MSTGSGLPAGKPGCVMRFFGSGLVAGVIYDVDHDPCVETLAVVVLCWDFVRPITPRQGFAALIFWTRAGACLRQQ